ncbi:hypothetical protein ABZ801_05380 [Actinomadura sp. NPDC047616]|uniref:hypothetical protein n=1 Tax=Actinomadura sp. NPDC047616 TaxID=3155914 RepID=UPI0033FFCD67
MDATSGHRTLREAFAVGFTLTANFRSGFCASTTKTASPPACTVLADYCVVMVRPALALGEVVKD